MLLCGSRHRRRSTHLDLPILCLFQYVVVDVIALICMFLSCPMPVSVCPAKDRVPPCAARPTATARPRQARPTPQPYVFPPKKRVPVPNSARGRRGKPSYQGRTALSPGSVWIRGNRGVHNIFKELSTRGRPYTNSLNLISGRRHPR